MRGVSAAPPSPARRPGVTRPCGPGGDPELSPAPARAGGDPEVGIAAGGPSFWRGCAASCPAVALTGGDPGRPSTSRDQGPRGRGGGRPGTVPRASAPGSPARGGRRGPKRPSSHRTVVPPGGDPALAPRQRTGALRGAPPTSPSHFPPPPAGDVPGHTDGGVNQIERTTGLRSAPRNNKATRVLTRPGPTSKSSARD